MKILLTGFKSKENTTNASDIVVTSFLHNLPISLKSLTSNLVFKLINDNTHTVKEELENELKRTNASHGIFIGQAPGYNRITMETIATNYRFTAPPKNIGEPPQSDIIEKGGSAAFNVTLPDLQEIVQKLNKSGIPASISYNCGNSLCNQILYHGLHYAANHNKKLKCGFVHIPALTEQVLTQWPQHPFMPLDMTRKAIEIIINSVANEHEE